MSKKADAGQMPSEQRVTELVHAIAEAESALEQAFGGQVDAVLSDKGRPILLRATQEALETSERQFRAVFEGALDAMVIADDNGTLIDVNAAACELFGMPQAELLGKHIADFAATGYETERHWQEFVENDSQHGIFPLRQPGGKIRYAEYSATANFLPGRHLSVLRDVTAQRNLETRSRVLAQLAYRLSAVTSAHAAAEIAAVAAGELIAWDAFAFDLYFPKVDQIETILTIDRIDGAQTVVPTKYVGVPSSRGRKTIEQGAQLFFRSEPAVYEPGDIPFGDTKRPSLSMLFAPIRHQNRVLGLISVQSYTPQAYTEMDLETVQGLADHCGGIVYRLQQAEELTEIQARYQQLFDAANDAIFMASPDGLILEVNARACDLYGSSRQELIGQPISILAGEGQPENAEFLADERRQYGNKPFELVNRKPDGSLFAVEVTLSPFPIETDNRVAEAEPIFYLAIARDISSRKQTEAQLAALTATALKITHLLDTRQVLDLIAQEARAIIGAHMAIASFRDRRARSHSATALSLSDKYAAYREFDAAPTGEGIYELVYRENRPLRLTQAEVETHPAFRQYNGRTNKYPTLGGVLIVPLIGHSERTIGLLQLSDKYEGEFTAADEQLLVQLAQLAAGALENARLYADVQKAETRFRQMAESVDQVFWLRDAKTHKMLYASPAFEKVWGRPRTGRDVVDDDFVAAVVPEDLSIAQAAVEKLDRGQSIQLQVRIQRADGAIRWVQVKGFPIHDSAGLVYRIAGTAEDVTDRYVAEEQVKQRAHEFELLYETTRDLAGEQTLSAALQTIIDRASELIESSSSRLWLVDPERHDLHLVAGWSLNLIVGARIPFGKGIAGVVAETGEPILIRDYPHWEPRLRDAANEKDLPQTAMGVPMFYAGELVGVLTADDRRSEHTFTERDMRLLELFAGHAASVVRGAGLLEETRSRAKQFELLYETTRDLAAQHDVNTLLQTIVDRTASLFQPNAVRLYFLDKAQQELVTMAERGDILPVGVRVRQGQGVAGIVLQTRQPFIINDYANWTNRLPLPELAEVHSIVGVPLLYAGELMGVLNVVSRNPHHEFTSADARLLELLASQAASAIHNARLIQETRERAQQLELLYEVGLALNHELDPSNQQHLLLEAAMQALHADRACFLLYDETAQDLHFTLVLGTSAERLEQIRQQRFLLGQERGLVGLVAETHQVVNLPDVHNDPRWIVSEEELQAGLWVPVLFQNQLRGVLNVASTHRAAFDAQHEHMLVLYANQFGVAMENARLFAETNRQLQKLAALRTVDTAITTSFDLRLILEIHLSVTLRELQADAADILLLDSSLQTLTYVAGRGFRNQPYTTQSFWLGDLLAGRVTMERRTVTLTDLKAVPKKQFVNGVSADEFVSYVGVPLISKGQVKGVLEIFDRTPRQSSSEWLEFLDTLAGQAAIAIDNVTLHNDLQRKNHELALAYDSTIEGWSRALDLRDKETEGHTQRVTELTLRLAPKLGVHESDLINIKWGALLHDIGKMGIPDAILLKQGPLTDIEWEIMRRHPQYALDLLTPITYLRGALDIPYNHHEKWDGTGYPRGLKGETIPLPARIFAVVDVWDALTSDRPYRPAWTRERTSEHIQAGAGTHFDAGVVTAFLEFMRDNEYF